VVKKIRVFLSGEVQGCSKRTLGTLIAKVILFVQDVLFYDSSVGYNNLRPETGLRVNDHPIPQDYTGTNDGIVLDTAVFADMRVVVHDTSRYGTVRPDNDPVVEGR
jgi:hypothetical protein